MNFLYWTIQRKEQSQRLYSKQHMRDVITRQNSLKSTVAVTADIKHEA